MRKWISVVAIVLGVALGAGIATAVVTPTLFADTNQVREKIVRNQFTPDGAQPAFTSGWHMHPGLAVVQVQQGKLTIFQNCQKFTLHRGDTYIEVPHLPVNAVAKKAVTWTTTFVLANSTAGGADRLPATEPSCPRKDKD
jgi:quercetin dioxygenase-like cupin family protein